jgi:predicted nucleic acid-binding protein
MRPTTSLCPNYCCFHGRVRERNVTAPPEALDGDVLIAAQAVEESAVVLTNNTRHFDSLSVKALDWPQVPLP